MGSDFVVESMRHCFICLNETSPSPQSSGLGSAESSKCPIFSLQHLSKYLKLDMSRVFNETEVEAIPQHLLDKVKQSKLKVELCDECAKQIENFSGLYRQLEKIEMEVAAFLELIQGKLAKTGENGKLAQIGKLAESMQDDATRNVWKGKLNILEALRTETIQKCSGKLNGFIPRIKVRKLTMKYIKSQLTTLPPPRTSCEAEATLDLEMDRHQAKTEDDDGIFNSMPMPDDYDDDDDGNYSNQEDTEDEGLKATPLEADDNKDESTFSGQRPDSGFPFVEIAPAGQLTTNQPEFTFDAKRKQFKCGQCPMAFSLKQTCQRHYKSVHLRVKYKCTLCDDKAFKHSSTYYTHHKNVHVGVRFRCGVCHADFIGKGSLLKHQRVTSCKTGQPPAPKTAECHCHICGKGFVTEQGLRNHIKIMHSQTPRPSCETCGKKFNQKRHLKRHMKACRKLDNDLV